MQMHALQATTLRLEQPDRQPATSMQSLVPAKSDADFPDSILHDYGDLPFVQSCMPSLRLNRCAKRKSLQ